MKDKYMRKLRESLKGLDPKILIIEIAGIIVFIAALSAVLIIKYPDITKAFTSINAFVDFMDSHKDQGRGLYISIQALQVIISFIPGQIVQIAGGYMYGFWESSLYSLIGIAIGSGAAFYIARIVGNGPVKRFYGAEQVEKYTGLLSSSGAFAIMLFLYIIPGFPKDMLAFFAGLSNIKFRKFLPVSTLARFPAMSFSMLIGSQLGLHSYKASLILIIVCAALTGACYYFRGPLIRLSDRYFGIEKTYSKK